MGRLDDQTIWITGSARRLGREMALGCAREGADIVVHCRASCKEADRVAADIRAIGRNALVVNGDVGNPSDVSRMVSEIESGCGRLTALVNSAALFPRVPFSAITEKDFFAVIRTNLYGPMLCTQFALPLLEQAAPGRVVNMTDWAVARPYRRYAHYMASKGGLQTLTMAMARELAPRVLVNAIAPGPVLPAEDMDEEAELNVTDRMPVGRWVHPDAIVRTLVFILESTDLCGSTITVDGGRFLG